MSRRHVRTRAERPHHADRDRDLRRAARRDELLAAAVTVIRRDGPASSMEAIAAEAGVTKPILYRHFGDRRGLIHALAQQFSADLMEGLRASLAQHRDDPRAVLVSTIDAYLAFVERDRELYRFLVAGPAAADAATAAHVGGFMREISQQVAVVLRERLAAAGADTGGAEPIAHGLVGMVHAAGDWWVEARSMTRPRLVDYLATALWSGLGALTAPAPAKKTTKRKEEADA